MASAVASKVATPKSVYLLDIFASPSASGKTVAPVFSTGGAPLRCSDDGVKDSTAGEGKDGVKDSTGKGKDGVKDSTGEGKDGVKDSTGKDFVKDSIPKLFVSGDALGLFPEAAMRDLLLALSESEDGGAASSMTGFSPRGWWVTKEDADVVQLKVAMPGLGKEHVKVRAEKGVLVIKGESDKDSEGDDDKAPARYTYRIGLSSYAFKMDQIKSEMKNGVLRLTVPKIKEEERKDVFEINIE